MVDGTTAEDSALGMAESLARHWPDGSEAKLLNGNCLSAAGDQGLGTWIRNEPIVVAREDAAGEAGLRGVGKLDFLITHDTKFTGRGE